ncbi:unnamed protein product [Durusdinium trenchii]|uniref:Uncharacterized protein n=1 Tax=Durusdinium trenchii TaxID=1381693 RepID=A0ABP0MJW7_9DINO
MDPKRLKEYCHRASDAQCAGAIGGELGGGLGAYCFESMHREMCSGFDHQIGMAEGIGGIQVGSWASIPARTRPKQASAAIHQNELQQEEVSGAKAFDRPKAASGNLGVAWQHKRKQTRTMCSDSVGNLSRRHLV